MTKIKFINDEEWAPPVRDPEDCIPEFIIDLIEEYKRSPNDLIRSNETDDEQHRLESEGVDYYLKIDHKNQTLSYLTSAEGKSQVVMIDFDDQKVPGVKSISYARGNRWNENNGVRTTDAKLVFTLVDGNVTEISRNMTDDLVTIINDEAYNEKTEINETYQYKDGILNNESRSKTYHKNLIDAKTLMDGTPSSVWISAETNSGKKKTIRATNYSQQTPSIGVSAAATSRP